MNRINFKRFSTNKIQIIHFIIIQGGQECRYHILLFMIHLKNDDLLLNLYIFIIKYFKLKVNAPKKMKLKI